MSKRILVGALSALAVSWMGIIPAGAAASSPWSQTGSNAALSRANPSERTLSASSIMNVVARHRFAGHPDKDYGELFEAPILGGGKIFVGVDHGVSAYDAATGQRLWHTTLETPGDGYTYSFQNLSLVGGRIFVAVEDATSQSDPSGDVVALNASTGATIWRKRGVGPVMSMVVSGGFVITAGVSVQAGSVLTALRASTGAVAWSKYAYWGGANAIVVAGKVIYDSYADDAGSSLAAYALATGVRSWQRSGDWDVQRGDNDGATTGHHIYAATESGVVNDINPKNGATRFVLSGAGYVIADDAKHVYAMCHRTSVCAYDTATGAPQWTRTNIGVQYSAAAANGLFYSVHGQVVDSATGRTVRTFPYKASALVVGDGRIAVVGTYNRYLSLYGLPGS